MKKYGLRGLTLLGVSLALLISCGGEESCTIAETNLSGTINGDPWAFSVGETNAFLSEGDDDFSTRLYPNAFEACVDSPPMGGALIAVSVPKAPGDYEFDNFLNMTFVLSPGDNLATFSGRIRVDEVTDTEVKGGLCGSADGGNDVSGLFTASICP